MTDLEMAVIDAELRLLREIRDRIGSLEKQTDISDDRREGFSEAKQIIIGYIE